MADKQLVITGGKQGPIYLAKALNLGGYQPTANNTNVFEVSCRLAALAQLSVRHAPAEIGRMDFCQPYGKLPLTLISTPCKYSAIHTCIQQQHLSASGALPVPSLTMSHQVGIALTGAGDSTIQLVSERRAQDHDEPKPCL